MADIVAIQPPLLDLTKEPALAIAAGVRVFWDNTNRRITATATGNFQVGIATQAALAADASLIADPHLGVDAQYRQGGTGAPISLRVLRSSPDRLADAFGTEMISASDILSLAIATLPDIAAGDSFSIGNEVLTVRHAERDASGTAWRIFCQR